MANNVAKLGGLSESRWLEEKKDSSRGWALALPITLGVIVFLWEIAA